MEINNAQRYKVLNTYVDALTMNETIKKVEEIIKLRKPTQHVVINASKVLLIEKDEKLKNIIDDCPIINADGASIVWASKICKIPLKERVTGIDLFTNLITLSSKQKYKIFLFGAREEVVLKVKEVFEKQHPGIQIVGYNNGYFTENNEQEIIEKIQKSQADILFVAFSSPKKEFWINKNLNKLNIPFVMGVGGSFDVIAGVTRRAPIWMQKAGLEWFYRFFQEPKRMWKRYLIGNIKFFFLIIKYKFKKY